MIELIKLTLTGTITFFIVLAFALGFIYLVNRYKNVENGLFHFIPYILLFVFAVFTITSGRDLSLGMFEVLEEGVQKSSIATWLQRITTIIVLLVSLERIVNGYIHQRYKEYYFPLWFVVIIIFWTTTVLLPALFSDHPTFSHEYFYPLLMLVASLFLNNKDRQLFLFSMRNGLIGFVLLSCIFIIVKPTLVLELDYDQGLIPGLPRFAGLAPHAVLFGSLALFSAVMLYFIPYKNKHLNRFLWVIVIFSLFMAQSKTSWLTAVIFVVVFYLYQEIQVYRMQGKISKRFLLKVIPIGLILILVPMVYMSFVGLDQLLPQSKLEELSTLTGRDVIWATILADSVHNSIFGYGPNYFQQFIDAGLLNVTHGHNQFFDTLAKSGKVGVFGLIVLFLYMLQQMFKFFYPSFGLLSILTFLFIFIKSISEIPLTLFGYSIDIMFLMLFIILVNMSSVSFNNIYKKKQLNKYFK